LIFGQIVQSQVAPDGGGDDLSDLLDALTAMQADETLMSDLAENPSGYSQQIDELQETEDRLTRLDTQLTEFQAISPGYGKLSVGYAFDCAIIG
jgi:hypothetical protein